MSFSQSRHLSTLLNHLFGHLICFFHGLGWFSLKSFLLISFKITSVALGNTIYTFFRMLICIIGLNIRWKFLKHCLQVSRCELFGAKPVYSLLPVPWVWTYSSFVAEWPIPNLEEEGIKLGKEIMNQLIILADGNNLLLNHRICLIE